MANTTLPRRRSVSRWDLTWTDRDAYADFAIPSARPMASRVIPRQISGLFDWIKTRSRGRVQDLGSRFRDLFYMRLDLADQDDWYCVRALGRGGFGAVALYQKFNASGVAIDEIVVKTAEATHEFSTANTRLSISREAAIMAQTNKSDEDGLLLLRNFVPVIRDDHAMSGSVEWRYYFEFCQHGDLDRLRIKYKAYGRYFPEAFLWHLFYWLARGIERYADGIENGGSTDPMWRDVTDDRWGQRKRGGYLLHNDLKPHNIFLGDADPDEQYTYYPIPRIGDLGLADITDATDTGNKAYNMRKGTPGYLPPEQRCNQINPDTDFYPVEYPILPPNSRHRKEMHHIRSSANVFGIGMIMFQMLTLHESSFLDSKIDQIIKQEDWSIDNPRARGTCLIKRSDLMTGRCRGFEGPYSDALKAMIEECLMINPSDRVDEHELRDETLMYYINELHELPGDSDDLQAKVYANARVYYSQNDIHQAGMNPSERRYRMTDWARAEWWQHRFLDGLIWQPREWGNALPPDMPSLDQINLPANWPRGLAMSLFGSIPTTSTPELTRSTQPLGAVPVLGGNVPVVPMPRTNIGDPADVDMLDASSRHEGRDGIPEDRSEDDIQGVKNQNGRPSGPVRRGGPPSARFDPLGLRGRGIRRR